MYGSCFCICSPSLCLLVGAFSLFTFKVFIDICVRIPILSVVLDFFFFFLVLFSSLTIAGFGIIFAFG